MNTQSTAQTSVMFEVVTIQISPYHTARGALVRRGPEPNTATVDVDGKLLRGICVSNTPASAAKARA